ncbi:uncharacterized protein [Battus philenor]|uniref:uncharacterized protein n=1 Tax=Battus philenor TaxID=42288 RepID=UPI0035D10A77
MAYNLGERFSKLPQYYPLLDPGTYETTTNVKIKANEAPFLSKSPRVCQQANKIWTHAIYNPRSFHKIPNCSAFLVKQPRFPYESLTKEELDEILCECDLQKKCECEPEADQKVNVIIEPPYQPRIYIGPFPRSNTDEGLSMPCKRDRGFLLLPDGSKKRSLVDHGKDSPPFLDTEVKETGSFYRGCKWSQWTSKRSTQAADDTPGPTTYDLKREPTESYLCAEKVRFNRRKNSKQYRFIEMVQQKNIREKLPGPATYSPTFPKGTDLQFLGPKADRFITSQYNVTPGPTAYTLKSDFDLPEPPIKECHAKLPERPVFGLRGPRFKPIRQEGPGPAEYNTTTKLCRFAHYPTTPFGTSVPRFIETKQEVEESTDEEVVDEETEPKTKECKNSNLSWMFKSVTERMEPLRKKLREPSPADLVLSKAVTKRPLQFQMSSPFFTSEPRFKPWYNWIPVHGKEQTPGPGKFYLEKVSCTPAVVRGPLCRCDRFEFIVPQSPPCTAYKTPRGIEKILETCNERLKENIAKKHAFHWEPSKSKRKLSNTEKEKLLINKSIALLNTDLFSGRSSKTDRKTSRTGHKIQIKKKMLRCFL